MNDIFYMGKTSLPGVKISTFTSYVNFLLYMFEENVILLMYMIFQ